VTCSKNWFGSLVAGRSIATRGTTITARISSGIACSDSKTLRSIIVPFFHDFPLRTSKRENFEKFARIIELMELRRHLSVSGIIEIAEIAQTMNDKRPSKVLRILRDHTPALF
jgi:hypothetical protein